MWPRESPKGKTERSRGSLGQRFSTFKKRSSNMFLALFHLGKVLEDAAVYIYVNRKSIDKWVHRRVVLVGIQ